MCEEAVGVGAGAGAGAERGKCTTKNKNPTQRCGGKDHFVKHFLQGFLRGKLLAPKLRKSADKSLSQPGCSHSNTIYDLQLQKENSITHAAAAPSNLDAAITMRYAASRRKPARIYAHDNKT